MLCVAFCLFKTIHNLHYEQIGKEVRCIEDELPFEIPDSWEWTRLNFITSELGDGIHGTPEYDLEGTFYFILTIYNRVVDKFSIYG